MAEGLLLVLDHRGTEVTYEAGTLRVQRPHSPPERLPLELLGSVVVHGSPMVSCEVWRRLAERGVSAVLLPARGHGGEAWVAPGLVPALRLRRAQHRAAPGRVLACARRVLEAKLAGQTALLERLAGPDSLPLLGTAPPAVAALAQIAHGLAGLAAAGDPESLMGLEGQAAAAWYGWLRSALPERWGFTGRNRRPPRDPLNALLSLGYTLLGSEVRSAVVAAGLDPALGFLHQPYPGRESLVLDCMEPLRPGVDAFALALLDTVLEPEAHFRTHAAEGCRLTKEGREPFYTAWAAARREWPQPGVALTENQDPGLPAASRRVVAELCAELGNGKENADG